MDLEIPSEPVYTQLQKDTRSWKPYMINVIMPQFKLQHNDTVKAYYGVAAEWFPTATCI